MLGTWQPDYGFRGNNRITRAHRLYRPLKILKFFWARSDGKTEIAHEDSVFVKTAPDSLAIPQNGMHGVPGGSWVGSWGFLGVPEGFKKFVHEATQPKSTQIRPNSGPELWPNPWKSIEINENHTCFAHCSIRQIREACQVARSRSRVRLKLMAHCHIHGPRIQPNRLF